MPDDNPESARTAAVTLPCPAEEANQIVERSVTMPNQPESVSTMPDRSTEAARNGPVPLSESLAHLIRGEHAVDAV